MRAAMVLCDAAQVTPDGKVQMLGAGWRICGPVLRAHAVVAIVSLASHEAEVPHQTVLELVDEDGHAVVVPGPQGPMMIRSEGTLPALGHPEGLPIGHEADVPFVADVGAGLPLAPGRTYVWQLWIDGDTHDEWRQPFYVRPQETATDGPA